MKPIPFRKSFNGLNPLANGLAYQHEARTCGSAVDDHGACTALAYAAAVLGPRQTQIRTQNIEKGPVGLRFQKIFPAVDMEFKLHVP